MGNVKQGLYEERNHLRTVRRRIRGQYDEGAFELLYVAIKHMLQEFKQLERPFVIDLSEKSEYALPLGDMDDYYNTNYRAVTLGERIIWLRTRGKVLSLAQSLSRVQTRRIARQTLDSSM